MGTRPTYEALESLKNLMQTYLNIDGLAFTEPIPAEVRTLLLETIRAIELNGYGRPHGKILSFPYKGR